MDIAKQLQAYEVEYHVLQDELIDSSLNDNQRLDKLEKSNSSLRKQNFDLLEELQVQFIFHIWLTVSLSNLYTFSEKAVLHHIIGGIDVWSSEYKM